ncbi:MAG: hypothetical protein KDE22_17465 [Rhodobacterales bacterium]|nr:hypothetical protein [Rhodobacterales bacterium]
MPVTEESQVFAKIVRYIAGQADDVSRDDETPEGRYLAEALSELAQAFETTGGFEFKPEQAPHLAHTFSTLEAAMRALSAQARQLEQHNAAAKMEWAADQASRMSADCYESHRRKGGGIIAFAPAEEGEAEG